MDTEVLPTADRILQSRLDVSGMCAITDRMEDRRAHQGTKRHARLQHSPGAPLLWVGDDEDWKIARAKHRLLACPEPDCDIELIAVQNDNNRYNPRFFRFKTATRTCELPDLYVVTGWLAG